MLVYKNKGKETKINGNEIESIDIVIKEIKGKPFIPLQYVAPFNNAKIKVNSVIEIIINNIVVDSYDKKITICDDMLDNFKYVESLDNNELLERLRSRFKNERDELIEIVLRNRIK